MTERRYSDEEVAAIFARATETQDVRRRQAGPATGMTLAELEEIGREAGITPEAVRHAASQLDRKADSASHRFLGLPIGVGRTAELGRELTESEWDRLVVDLRETFDARGKVSGHGSFRQWTNGNLQALLEPTATGHRLRMRTTKGNARAMIMAGMGVTALGVIPGIIGALYGAANAGDAGSLALVGVGLIVAGAAQLPSWARQRATQMEAVIGRLVRTTSTPPASAEAVEPPRD